MSDSIPLKRRQSYPLFQQHAARLASADMVQLFARDPSRARHMTATAAGLELDYSKHLLDGEALGALLTLAAEADLEDRARALLDGEQLNNTEQRAALHSLLRASSSPPALADRYSAVDAARQQMRHSVERLNEGRHQGYSGEVITNVVNIGIGGSDL